MAGDGRRSRRRHATSVAEHARRLRLDAAAGKPLQSISEGPDQGRDHREDQRNRDAEKRRLQRATPAATPPARRVQAAKV